MTTVALQGQGGGLPAAEWTLASVLKQGGYHTYFIGKWHLGEADYALPNAQGYDEMRSVGLYHLNAYPMPTRLVPGHARCLARLLPEGDQGRALRQRRRAGDGRLQDQGQYVDTPVIDGKEGVVGIPFLDSYIEKAALEFLDEAAKTRTSHSSST